MGTNVEFAGGSSENFGGELRAKCQGFAPSANQMPRISLLSLISLGCISKPFSAFIAE
jgi:hypothetical protein